MFRIFCICNVIVLNYLYCFFFVCSYIFLIVKYLSFYCFIIGFSTVLHLVFPLDHCPTLQCKTAGVLSRILPCSLLYNSLCALYTNALLYTALQLLSSLDYCPAFYCKRAALHCITVGVLHYCPALYCITAGMLYRLMYCSPLVCSLDYCTALRVSTVYK